jgi:hypothetical protein
MEHLSKRDVENRDNTQAEVQPDVWTRFENAVDAALRTAPKHRPAKGVESSPKSAKRRTGKFG